MTIKEWLQKARKLNNEVEQLKMARQKALNLACEATVGVDNEKVQTSKINSTESKFVTYADYSKLLDAKIYELTNYRIKVLGCINKLDNSTYRTLLIARYINCKTWEQIAEDMQFKDVRWTYVLHGRALKKMEEAIKPLPSP